MLLQSYQALHLQELAAVLPEDGQYSQLLREICIVADHEPGMSRYAVLYLGKGIAQMVVNQRHLWLTLLDMGDAETLPKLDARECLQLEK